MLKPVQVLVKPVFRSISYARLFGQSEKMKAAQQLEHFRHWIYICSTKNAQSVAAVPLHLYVTTNRGQKAYPNLRKGIDTKPVENKRLKELHTRRHLAQKLNKAVMVEEVIEHPFLDLWQKANQREDGFEMLSKLQLFLELTGNAYMWVQKDSLGVPIALWTLQSQFVKIVPGENDFVMGYLYGTSPDTQVALTADEVVHFKFTNPHDVFYGFSPIQAAFAAIKRKEDYDAYEDALLTNNARPDFALKHKGKVNSKTLKEIRERWSQLYGKGKTGSVAVLEGDLDIQQIGFSPRDIAFLKGQKFSREEILGVYGVPLSKVTTQDVNLANAEVGEVQYQRDTVVPRLNLDEDKLNQDLVGMFDERLFVAFDNPVPEDKQFKLSKSDTYIKNGVLTINEVREQEGLEPVAWGRTPWMPMTMIPVGSSGQPPALPEPESEKTKQKGGSGAAELLPPMHFHVNLFDQDGRLMHMTQNEVKQSILWQAVPEMARIMRQIFREWKEDMLKQLEKMKVAVPAAINAKGEGVPEWTPEMLEREKWAAEINRRMSGAIRKQLVHGGQRGLTMVGSGISFNVLNPEIQTWLETYTFHFADITATHTSAEFAAQMQAGFTAGEDIPELRSRLLDFWENRMERWKAEQIARTESTRAAHQGMLKGFEQSKVVRAVVWDAQADACPFCTELDGRVVGLGTAFFEQGQSMDVQDAGTLKFDYEPVTSPPLHPNCRCTLRAELKGE